MEHYCKSCINDGDNICKFTGAYHDTGIECPSFGPKKEEIEMFKVGDRVRVIADEGRLREISLPRIRQAQEGQISDVGLTTHLPDLPIRVLFGEDDVMRNPCRLAPQDLELVEEEDDGLQGLNEPQPPIRTFDSGATMESYTRGATRTACETKIDPEGFFSPLVMLRYSEYMHKCRVQADGTLRDSDNWQGGIPLWRYMKGKWRHFLDTWLMHRGYKKVTTEGLNLQDCLCAELFNTMGYLHVVLCKEKCIESVAKDLQAPVPGGAHKNFNRGITNESK